MAKYILKRIIFMVLILLGVSLILYVLVRCMPTSFVDNKLLALTQGKPLDEVESLIHNLKAAYGLDKSIIEGYFSWLGNVLKGDFGDSFTRPLPVSEVIFTADKIGVSFLVAFIATVFEFMIAIPLGITAATHQYSVRDYVVTVLVLIGISLPTFFFGQILKEIFANKLHWATPAGFEASGKMTLKAIWVPILTVVILSIGGRMRLTRTNMLEVLNADYIRTARAKGLRESTVIYKHAFRNTLIPIVTGLAGLIPSLFSGAIITEQVFNLPGIGNFALKAMMDGDIPVIMTYNMFLAFLSVLGVLLSDLMYGLVDPRVKLTA